MIVLEADNEDVTWLLRKVANGLRDDCFVEVAAHRLERDIEAVYKSFLSDLENYSRFALGRYVFCDNDGEPIAVFCIYRAGAVEAAFQVFSNDRWLEVALPMVRWLHRHISSLLVNNGIRVGDVTAYVPPERQDILDRWFAAIHCFPCGKPMPRGKNGELYQHYVWLAPALEKQEAA